MCDQNYPGVNSKQKRKKLFQTTFYYKKAALITNFIKSISRKNSCYIVKMSTSAVFEYERDAIRVKARFYTKSKENNEEIRKFSVDPNLTSYDTLRNLLSRAFDLKDDLNETFR